MHGFEPLWVCAACQTQCTAPVVNLHCGVALCAPCSVCASHPSVCAPCPGNRLPLTLKRALYSPNHFATFLYDFDLHNDLVGLWKLVYKDLGVMGLIFCFFKTHFGEVRDCMTGHLATETITALGEINGRLF